MAAVLLERAAVGLLALGLGGCGSAGGGSDAGGGCLLASVLCARRVACDTIEEAARPDCLEDHSSLCDGAALCGPGERPLPSSIAACASELAAQTCGSVAGPASAPSVCPDARCVPDIPGNRSLNDRYFGGYEPPSGDWCAGDEPLPPVNGMVRVRLFRASEVSDDTLAANTRQLQRYFEPFGLWFYATAAPTTVGFTSIISGSRQELEGAAKKLGIPIPIPPGYQPSDELLEQFQVAAADILYRDLRDFVAAWSAPAAPEVNVVVLRDVASDAFLESFPGPVHIGGMEVSPALLSRVERHDPSAYAAELLGLPESFTPTLFVADDELRAIPGWSGAVMAHEMGHALGLAHTGAVENLMASGGSWPGCQPTLTQDQVDRLVGVEPLP